ncbi:hypothetical protein SNOG_15056 [Parastagonospora nodorum SN15]|uniref:CHCH domain-containing protein n=1 Tax=Phaeosphaeria nodorum (strain SN15 / ATCC MYA-4574 / FGSC 10173) TaxID=321614 RepID=Q0TZQ1_PHANO|nr:hypothetical protein SNOG_15056 [Parastagonospora nodorum SN15]EAT77599.1 hypothetical protein SNOG_15056 [Parastagonospora nodorum SN15]
MTLTFKLTPPQLILDAVNLIASYGRALRTATPQPTPQNATSAKMSTFGGAGLGQKIQKPNPPERGSFPLDHDGTPTSTRRDPSLYLMAHHNRAEHYKSLTCIKSHRGSNDPECRNLSKSYLSCRMDRYVHTSLFVICLQPHPTHVPIGPGYDVFSSSKGAEDLVIPTCQNLSNQVAGKNSRPAFEATPIPTSFCHTASAASEWSPTLPQLRLERLVLTIPNRNLMAPDSFKNLGFGDDSDTPAGNATSTQPSQPQAQVQDRPRGS